MSGVQMKKRILAFGVAAGLVALGFGHTTLSQEFGFLRSKTRDKNFLSDEKFLEMVRTYRGMYRVTEKPYLMHLDVQVRCNFSLSEPGKPIPPDPFKSSIHGDRYCDVFVSDDAKEPIQNAGKTYPVGSVIIKAKYPDDKRGNIELFTVMRKREAGYFPDHGDWEFTVVDGEAKRVLSRGRIESCTDCHDGYQNTDFVTRVYLQTQEERERM